MAAKNFRVRKSIDDAYSQVGMYSSLESAITKAEESGDEYKVFDISIGEQVWPEIKDEVTEDIDHIEESILANKEIEETQVTVVETTTNTSNEVVITELPTKEPNTEYINKYNVEDVRSMIRSGTKIKQKVEVTRDMAMSLKNL